jgi:ParB family chromosome partitioning protein
MKLRKLDPKTIMVPEVRVTARFDDETFAMFQQSIKEAGQVAPIICSIIDGQVVLIDGLHRLQEAIRAQAPTIDVALIDGDIVDALARNIYLDKLRGKTPVSEMVKVIESLYKEYNVNIEELVKRTGLTRDYIEGLIVISELTPRVRAALDDEAIKVGHARALARIKDPVKQEAVFDQLRMYHWTVKALEEYIDEVLQIIEAPPPPHEEAGTRAPVRIKCTYCAGEFDVTEIANPNTCRSCSLVMFQAIAAARQELEQDKNSSKG